MFALGTWVWENSWKKGFSKPTKKALVLRNTFVLIPMPIPLVIPENKPNTTLTCMHFVLPSSSVQDSW